MSASPSARTFSLRGARRLRALIGDAAEGVDAVFIDKGVDFFAANENEIGFREWMAAWRTDLVLHQENFAETEEAGAASCAPKG